jgi:antitoxin (DNA-binding transcriptional repressor) of toxin-antitoxin stability system
LGFGNCSSERRPPSGGCAGGEILGVTDRGQLVAVLAPPSVTVGTGSLIAAGRVSLARRIQGPLPAPVAASRSIGSVLDELRGER